MDSQGAGVSSLAIMTSSPVRQPRVLILGGTADANRLAQALANDSSIEAILSYAGRTENPTPPPVPWRVGGFGGVDGLKNYLVAENIRRVVDATHPFAAQMSASAWSQPARSPACRCWRWNGRPWQRVAGDRWTEVDNLPGRGRRARVWRRGGCFSASGGSIWIFSPRIRSTFIWSGWSIRRARRCRCGTRK